MAVARGSGRDGEEQGGRTIGPCRQRVGMEVAPSTWGNWEEGPRALGSPLGQCDAPSLAVERALKMGPQWSPGTCPTPGLEP